MSKERQFEEEVLEELRRQREFIEFVRRFDEEILSELRYQHWLMRAVLNGIHRLEGNHHRLSYILIRFSLDQDKGDFMSAGPLTLTTAGQVATATVQGFDQFGNPMPAGFTMPAVAYSIDDTAGLVVKAVDNGDGTATITAVANGTANLTATATSAEGLALSDSQSITVAIAATPVLSGIKIAFV